MTFRKALSIAPAVAAICCFTIADRPAAAASTAPNITYTASGTFASTPTSGNDTLKLAGEPFSVSIVVSASTPPYKTGPNWAAYHQLKLTGSVHSGLIGPTPVSIASGEASIIQAINGTIDDVFTMEAPLKVVGVSLTIKAVVLLPAGTLSNQLLHPFSAVTMAPANATVTYSDGSDTTTLGVQTGTLTATIPAASTGAKTVALHPAAARVVTVRGDGTQSVQSATSAPVDVSSTANTVTLRLYAYGVSGASEVHAQIGGQEVPLLYAGPSGYYPGLDEVMIQVPSSMAGMGDVPVVVTADGQSSNPVHIHIQ